MTLGTTTLVGLHDYLVEEIVPPHISRGGLAVDLGAGTGALASRLLSLGLNVTAADINPNGFKASVPFILIDLNKPNFSARLGESKYDLVTAVEVIEHVESPIGFLRNLGRLLKPKGIAVITTPNVDSVPARVKFLLTGTVRMMDRFSEPTHISPILWALFERQYLPRAGLTLLEHHVFPNNSYKLTRQRYVWSMRVLAKLLPGEALFGDDHILVLERKF